MDHDQKKDGGTALMTIARDQLQDAWDIRMRSSIGVLELFEGSPISNARRYASDLLQRNAATNTLRDYSVSTQFWGRIAVNFLSALLLLRAHESAAKTILLGEIDAMMFEKPRQRFLGELCNKSAGTQVPPDIDRYIRRCATEIAQLHERHQDYVFCEISGVLAGSDIIEAPEAEHFTRYCVELAESVG